MHTRGSFAPETGDTARERYDSLGSTAQIVVKEVAKAMAFDEVEYDRRVTPAVIETARDALFAAELVVHVGTREEYEDWLADRDYEAVEVGSENVSRVSIVREVVGSSVAPSEGWDARSLMRER